MRAALLQGVGAELLTEWQLILALVLYSFPPHPHRYNVPSSTLSKRPHVDTPHGNDIPMLCWLHLSKNPNQDKAGR